MKMPKVNFEVKSRIVRKDNVETEKPKEEKDTQKKDKVGE
jgi:hypothetical protein